MLEKLCLNWDGLDVRGIFILLIMFGNGFIIYWVRRQEYFFGRRYFVLCNLAMVAWLLAALAEIQSGSLHCKMVWSAAAWPAIGLLPTSWAFFLLHYAFNLNRDRTGREMMALVAGPVVIAALAWTNGYHHLFYGTNTALLMVRGGMTMALYDHGPLFYASAAYLYLYMMAALVIVAVGAYRSQKAQRTYFEMLLIGSAIPLLSNMAYVLFDQTLFGFDPTPFAFSVVLLLFTWLIFTDRLFDVTTIARDLLFYNVRDPVLVVDAAGVVAGANPAARRMLDGDGARIGGKIGDWPHMAAFAAVTEQGGSAALPATLHFDDRHLSVEVLPIEKPLGRDLAALGHVIVLNDTTELRRNNLQLTAALATNERRLQEITRLRDDLERQIILDPLTGVHNRRGLDATFDALAGQAPAGESDLILALLDIDHFKAINDNHGHDVGDRVLRDFARMLRARVNAQLPVFRVGGEEFVIMFPRTDFATIDAQLARFRRDLVNSLFTRIADPVQISFSAGLASRPQDGTTFSAVFKRADDRLYAAKMAGRGCTRFTDAPDQNNAQKGA